jgi:predicted deacylase
MAIAGTSEPGDVVQTLYLSFLGRAADPAARTFLTQFTDLGDPAAVAALGDALVASDEFQNSFAAGSSENYVRSVYFNLFDRNADIEEVAFWTDRLDAQGLDRSDLPAAVLEGARESDLEAYEAKLFIADYVTDQTERGGWVPDALTFPALRGNEELWADLNALDAQYDTLALEVVGQSLNARPLYAATVGTGEAKLLFITQQHGDEPIGTEAAMYFLDFLAGDTALAQSLRGEVTVTVVPRVNPDGFARWEREVGGERGLVDPRLNDNEIDLNRTYDPAAPVGADVAPEAVAVRELVARLGPDYLFDYHGQGNYRDAEGELDTMSVLWPTNTGVDPAVVDASKRAIAAIVGSLEESDYDQLTLYPGADTATIARNGFGLSGTPTVLVEQRFGQEMTELARGLDLDYSALISALALEGFITMQGLVEASADGSIGTLDPAIADQVPQRSPSITYAELYSDDRYGAEEVFIA